MHSPYKAHNDYCSDIEYLYSFLVYHNTIMVEIKAIKALDDVHIGSGYQLP